MISNGICLGFAFEYSNFPCQHRKNHLCRSDNRSLVHSQYIRQRKNRNPFPSSCLSPAEEGSRTLKVLLPHGPEPCASANSATSAFAYLIKHGTFKYQCGRWDLNPHDHATTRSLVLPVCQFQHSRSTCYNIAQFFQFCNTFFEFFLFFHLLYTISLYAILGVVLITQV